MIIPLEVDPSQETSVAVDITADAIFDPGASFGEWCETVEHSGNRMPSALLPGFYLENGEWEFDEELNGDHHSTERFRSEGTLVIATHGKLQGNIEVNTAVIDGVFRGKITATENVVLESHAVVVGEIHTPTLEIRGGAIIEGTCHFETLKPEPVEPPAWELIKVGLSRVWRGRMPQ